MKHHRIKSTRIEKNAKEIRRLYREHRRLWAEKWNAPPVELEEPFIRGFERFLVLTPQARQREDAEKLTLLLEFFQNHQCCRKGWFRNSRKPSKRWAKGEVGKHCFRRFQLVDLIKISFPPDLYPYLNSYFINLKNGLPPLRHLKRHQLNGYVRIRLPHLFESHTQPHLVTHLLAHDPQLEARLDYIDKRLWGGAETAAVSNALHSRKYYREYPSRTEKSARDDFRQQLKEANSDPTIKSAISPRFFCVHFFQPN